MKKLFYVGLFFSLLACVLFVPQQTLAQSKMGPGLRLGLAVVNNNIGAAFAIGGLFDIPVIKSRTGDFVITPEINFWFGSGGANVSFTDMEIVSVLAKYKFRVSSVYLYPEMGFGLNLLRSAVTVPAYLGYGGETLSNTDAYFGMNVVGGGVEYPIPGSPISIIGDMRLQLIFSSGSTTTSFIISGGARYLL